MCFTVIKNICCFSTAFYIQLVQQKVPASQYVLLSFGFNHCDERIQVQQCHLFECRWRCCQRAPHAPRRRRELFIISPIELIFMMFLLGRGLCTKLGESYMDESIRILFSRKLQSSKIPSWRSWWWNSSYERSPIICCLPLEPYWLLKYCDTVMPVGE